MKTVVISRKDIETLALRGLEESGKDIIFPLSRKPDFPFEKEDIKFAIQFIFDLAGGGNIIIHKKDENTTISNERVSELREY